MHCMRQYKINQTADMNLIEQAFRENIKVLFHYIESIFQCIIIVFASFEIKIKSLINTLSFAQRSFSERENICTCDYIYHITICEKHKLKFNKI